jgi:hypothetical protein
MAIHQNQAEYDRASGALSGNEQIAAFRAHVHALFPNPPETLGASFNTNGNHVFVWVNSCTRFWTPGTQADYSVGIYIAGLSYNGGGKTVEGAIRRAREFFDDFVAEKVSGCIARAFGGDPFNWRAPHRATDWND